MSACPEPAELERWLREGLTAQPETGAHVAGCESCRLKAARLRSAPGEGSGLQGRKRIATQTQDAPTVRVLRDVVGAPSPVGVPARPSRPDLDPSTVANPGRAPPPVDATAPTPVSEPNPIARDPGDREPGDLLGRFVIINAAGAGGMGFVYAAYDPELDRKVAIKLLRNDLPGELAEDLRNRLLREAQAMARLSHPNVVPVYDVGTAQGQVFVAMEFVEGQTLATHLSAKAPPWRDIVALYVKAGQGLLAAHEAGLVHRDFKPQNVLVSKSGEVRVVDFGLARPAMAGVGGPTRPTTKKPLPSNPMLDTPLTRPGLLMGTPAYMAPEQFYDQAVDARTDQFSFCVALYESLYGQRPYAGDTVEALVKSMDAGALLPPPRNAKVPARVLKVLTRGLLRDPAKRWPSMAPLLAELSRDPYVARRRIFMGAAVVATLAASVGASAAWSRHAQTLCLGAEQKLTGAWDTERKDALKRAFVGTGAPFAADVFATAERLIDAYTVDWVKMRTDACEATRLRGEQSERLLDLRIQCLDRKLGQVGALLTVFETPDAKVVEHAVQAVESLGSLNECADLRQLGADAAPLPAAAKAEVDQAYALMAKGRALADAQNPAQGLERAKEALAAAKQSGALAVVSEAQLTLADLDARTGEQKASEQALVDAALAADGAKRDDLRARALTELGLAAFKAGRPNEALLEGQLANAALARAGGNDALQARLHHVLALVFHSLGRPEDAAAHFGKCVDLRKKAFGTDSFVAAASMEAFGKVLHEEGKLDEAVAQLQRALAIQQQTLGKRHPDVALTHQALGAALFAKGDFKEALAEQRTAAELLETQPVKDLALIGAARADVARTLQASGELEAAQTAQASAVAAFESGLPARHPSIAGALADLALLQLEAHDAKAALTTARRATALVDSESPPGLRAQALLAEVRAMWAVGAAHRKPAIAKAQALVNQLAPSAPKDAAVKELSAWLASPK